MLFLRSVMVVVAAGFLVSCGGTTTEPPTCEPDALEPNDAAGSATDVPEDGETYPMLALEDADEDWFRVTLCTSAGAAPIAAEITAEATFSHANGDLDIEILNDDATAVLGISLSTDDDESVSVIDDYVLGAAEAGDDPPVHVGVVLAPVDRRARHAHHRRRHDHDRHQHPVALCGSGRVGRPRFRPVGTALVQHHGASVRGPGVGRIGRKDDPRTGRSAGAEVAGLPMCARSAIPRMGAMPTSQLERPPVTPPPVADRPGGAPPPGSDSRLGRLGGWCFDHRRATVGLWTAVLVVVFAAAGATQVERHAEATDLDGDVGLILQAQIPCQSLALEAKALPQP